MKEKYFGVERKKYEAMVLKKIKELEEDGIKFIKFHFTNMQGDMREVTLTIEAAITGKGITTTDGSSVFGNIILAEESDMILIPDISTMVKIPWSERTARVICNIYHPPEVEGGRYKPYEGCPRRVLQKAVKSMRSVLPKKYKGKKIKKYHAYFAPEVEFIITNADYDHTKIHRDPNLANDHYFLPLTEKVDKTLKQILDYFGEAEIRKEKYHAEVATYQFEIGINHGNAVRIADAVITLKYIIKTVAEMNGLKASFLPKFNKEVNGNGMHTHQNLAITTADGKKHNLFYDPRSKDCLSPIAKKCFAGLLKHAKEYTAITNPTTLSYKRLVPGMEAPTYISWDWQNRTALLRGHSMGTKKIRAELRSPDPSCNPYFAFAAMLYAMFEGIRENLRLPKPEKRDYYHDHDNVEQLPAYLMQALVFMYSSAMLRKRMGKYVVEALYTLGKNSWNELMRNITEYEIKKYF